MIQAKLKPSSVTQADDTDAIKRWLRAYCASRVDFTLADERKCLPPHLVLDFGNRGLLGMTVSETDGGLALPYASFADVLEQLAAIDTTLCLFVGLANVLGIRPLERFGSPDAQSRYLRPLATGRTLGALAVTEPAAGSNPAAMTTTARRVGDGFVLSGTKHWIGNASWCGLLYVFARTFDEAGTYLGITGFIVDRDTPGLAIGPEAKTMGMRATAQSRVHLCDVVVPADHVLGEIGAGLEVAQDTMMRGRLVVAAAAIGAMKRCAQLMRRYASRRHISTGLLHDHPVTRTKLIELGCRIETVDALTRRVIAALDGGEDVSPAIYAACKLAATEFLSESSDDLIQVMGGRGYIETNHAPRIYRDARILRIFEGPSETLSAYVGSVALKTPQDLRAQIAAGFPNPSAFDEAMAQLPAVQRRLDVGHPTVPAIERRLLLREFAGRLATLAMLAAAIDEGAPARAWLRHRWAACLAELDVRAALLCLPSAPLFDALEGYEGDIGRFEPLSSGEDGEIDPYLRSLHGAEC